MPGNADVMHSDPLMDDDPHRPHVQYLTYGYGPAGRAGAAFEAGWGEDKEKLGVPIVW